MRMRRVLAVCALLALPVAAGAFLLQGRGPADGARLFAQVLQRIEDSAVDSLSRSVIYEKAARGLVKILRDPYADLYSPEELASFQRNTLRNKYGGLGMSIEPQEGGTVVGRVFPNTPAANGGVQAGDRIVQVDSVRVTGLRLDEVSALLLGQPGTQVEAIFQRPGLTQNIRTRFTRAIIRIPAVPFALMLDGTVGYIPLQSFNESGSGDVERAVTELRAKGARAFVVDVRGNGGGSLEEALEIGNLFLRPGQEIASVRHRGREPEVYRANRPSLIDSMPIVVMVDERSASASEIVAGTLQDHDRALVIGTTSFGKGLVQTLFPLDGGWAIKLTTGKWYTPSGRSIQAEHDRLEDDRFVEYAPDPPPGDTTERQRPVFKSDGGRPILGGGGVTPDLIVTPDTTTPPERELLRAVGPQSQIWLQVLSKYAADQIPTLQRDFTVTAAMRDEFLARLLKAGVPVTRAQFEAAPALVNRTMERRLAEIVFGDSTAFRRTMPKDPQIQAALALLRRNPTQRQLLALAEQAAKQP